ncbi:hypothetical protein H696_05848 [Fonticula alba]|uniref:Peptidase M28 domain-containing protein n=1 Tax=Fonticula alba TaxID=691883 RepID=A0A058Z0D7_FONAL|nr:hypothetical protein H696_05848 [Fonticula alba]KCV67739.1 hypothetical protein H696_05848 [Fonticula alba]|eukprot:XP_009497923.1 hypothetical protein H696_05848 [Fonticula alba]
MNFRRALITGIALFALLAAVVSAASPRKWALVPGATPEQIKDLIRTRDVRGYYHEDALLIIDENVNEFADLASQFPEARILADVEPSRKVYILEKDLLESDCPGTVRAWGSRIHNALNRYNAEILHSDSNRFIAMLPAMPEVGPSLFRDALLRDISLGTEILTVPEYPLESLLQRNQAALRELAATFGTEGQEVDAARFRLLDQVNEDDLRYYLEYLTGEASDSPFTTRNAYSTQAHDAARWIADQYTSMGFTTTLETFRDDMSPNVVAVLPGRRYPDKFVVLGAHYDSRAIDVNSPTTDAPGANDDGSGTSALLHIADLIRINKVSFDYTVIFTTFSAEEQGLVGSRAYAKAAKERGDDIVYMFQSDMLAFNQEGENFQTAFPSRYTDSDLVELASRVVQKYVPEVDVCLTDACCSDHQAFHELGYLSTQIFERCGPIADNQYHRPGDLVNRPGFSLEGLKYNTRSLMSLLLVFAQGMIVN